jgi:hypothetical protein
MRCAEHVRHLCTFPALHSTLAPTAWSAPLAPPGLPGTVPHLTSLLMRAMRRQAAATCRLMQRSAMAWRRLICRQGASLSACSTVAWHLDVVLCCPVTTSGTAHALQSHSRHSDRCATATVRTWNASRPWRICAGGVSASAWSHAPRILEQRQAIKSHSRRAWRSRAAW